MTPDPGGGQRVRRNNRPSDCGPEAVPVRRASVPRRGRNGAVASNLHRAMLRSGVRHDLDVVPRTSTDVARG